MFIVYCQYWVVSVSDSRIEIPLNCSIYSYFDALRLKYLVWRFFKGVVGCIPMTVNKYPKVRIGMIIIQALKRNPNRMAFVELKAFSVENKIMTEIKVRTLNV